MSVSFPDLRGDWGHRGFRWLPGDHWVTGEDNRDTSDS